VLRNYSLSATNGPGESLSILFILKIKGRKGRELVGMKGKNRRGGT